MKKFTGSALAVNDVEINLIVAQELLKCYGLSVETAEDGMSAIQAVRENMGFNIIFMDNKMPGISGVETTRQIRELGYRGKVVMLSGDVYSLEGLRDEKGNCDFDGVLLNPIDTEQLEDLLAKFLDTDTKAQGKENAAAKGGISNHRSLKAAFVKDARTAVKELKIPGRAGPFHAMKTALANMGLKKEAQKAFDLEQAASREDYAFIEANIAAFAQMLTRLADEVQQGLEQSGESPVSVLTQDKAYVREVFEAVIKACMEYDGVKADKLMGGLLEGEKPLKSAVRKFAEDMRDLIRYNSEFDEAAEKIAEFLKGAGI